MPETSPNTHTENVLEHSKKVRSLLDQQDLITIEDIQEHCRITRPQALTVLERMEANQELRVGRSSGRLFISSLPLK